MRAELVSRFGSLAPVVLTVGVALLLRPSRRQLTGGLVALAWNSWAILVVNLVAIHFGWWQFDSSLSSFMGVPTAPWIAWTILWGAFLPLVAAGRPLLPIVITVFWLDLIAMPLLSPWLVLNRGWLFGEAFALVLALIPSLLFSRWTAKDIHLRGRVALHFVTAGVLLLWLVPTVAVSRSGGWDDVFALPTWRLSLAAQLLLVPIALGVRAVSEFVNRGQGTPIPYDPPKQLVTSGPYSYVRNPMQLSMVLILAVAAGALWNPWLLASAITTVAYGLGLATWHEGIDLQSRFGGMWNHYRGNVRNWIPRWRPCVDGGSELLVAFSCSSCSSMGRWFMARSPIGLFIKSAESSGVPAIRRITYVPPSGPPSRGVAAVFHALEHLNLGWAIVGWVLLMPGIRHVAQLISDAIGPSPHNVEGMRYEEIPSCGRGDSNPQALSSTGT